MKSKIILVCSECLQSNYSVNKSSVEKRLSVKKYCKNCKKHTLHKENK